jgi:hypothetical protein
MLSFVQAAVVAAGTLTLAGSPDPGARSVSANPDRPALTLLADPSAPTRLPDFGGKAAKKGGAKGAPI